MDKVQCISNECGFFKKIKVGGFYFVDDYSPEIYTVYELNNKEKLSIGIYDKCLFRTLTERRDIRISKLLKK